MVNEPTVDLESNQVSLASDTMLLLPIVLGASSTGKALTAYGQEASLRVSFLRTGKSSQVAEFEQSFSKDPGGAAGGERLRLGGWGESSHWAPASAGILLTLGSSILTHPLVSQRENAKISWLNRRMGHR